MRTIGYATIKVGPSVARRLLAESHVAAAGDHVAVATTIHGEDQRLGCGGALEHHDLTPNGLTSASVSMKPES